MTQAGHWGAYTAGGLDARRCRNRRSAEGVRTTLRASTQSALMAERVSSSACQSDGDSPTGDVTTLKTAWLA
jgi:hypothetical protein